MCCKFRRVHALNSSNSVGIIPGCIDHKRILEYISPFWKPVEKEIGGNIRCGLVIAQPVLISISRKFAVLTPPPLEGRGLGGGAGIRFEPGCPHIFHMDEFEVSVNCENDSDFMFVADS